MDWRNIERALCEMANQNEAAMDRPSIQAVLPPEVRAALLDSVDEHRRYCLHCGPNADTSDDAG